MDSTYDCTKCLRKAIPLNNKIMHELSCKTFQEEQSKKSQQDCAIFQAHAAELSKEEKKGGGETSFCEICGCHILSHEKVDHMMSHQFEEEDYLYGNYDDYGQTSTSQKPNPKAESKPKEELKQEPKQNRDLESEPKLVPFFQEFDNKNVLPNNNNDNEEEVFNIVKEKKKGVQTLQKIKHLQFYIDEIKKKLYGYDNEEYDDGDGYDEYSDDMLPGDMHFDNFPHNHNENSHHPLPKRFLIRLTEIKIDNPINLEEDKRSCIICYELFQKDEKGVVLPCIHLFHSDCIKNWFKTSDICPVCKYNMKSIK